MEAEEKKKKKTTSKKQQQQKRTKDQNYNNNNKEEGGGGPEKKQRKKKRKTRGSQSRLASSLKTTSTGTGFSAVPPPPPSHPPPLPCHLCQHQRRRFQPARPDTGTLQYIPADSVSLQHDPSAQVHRQETADCWQLTLQRGSFDRHNDATGRRSQMTECLDPYVGRQTPP